MSDKTLRLQAQQYKKLYRISHKCKTDLDKIEEVTPELATYLLPHAIRNDDLSLLKLLIKNGAKLHTVDRFGNLPIHYFNQNLRILKFIVKKDKNCINESNSLGQTIIDILAGKNNYEAVKYLLRIGAAKDIKDKYKNTEDVFFSDYSIQTLLKPCMPIIEQIENEDSQGIINEGLYDTTTHYINSNMELVINLNKLSALRSHLNQFKQTIFSIASNNEKNILVQYSINVTLAKQDIKTLLESTVKWLPLYKTQILLKSYIPIIEKIESSNVYPALEISKKYDDGIKECNHYQEKITTSKSHDTTMCLIDDSTLGVQEIRDIYVNDAKQILFGQSVSYIEEYNV